MLVLHLLLIILEVVVRLLLHLGCDAHGLHGVRPAAAACDRPGGRGDEPNQESANLRGMISSHEQGSVGINQNIVK